VIRGILLDIEGTTTAISFVYDVLFPFVRRHVSDYVKHADLTDLRREYDANARKEPKLASLQPICEQVLVIVMSIRTRLDLTLAGLGIALSCPARLEQALPE